MTCIAIIIALEILIGIGIFFLMRNAQKVRLIVSHIISFVVSIVLVMGCFVVNKGQSTLKNVTSDNI